MKDETRKDVRKVRNQRKATRNQEKFGDFLGESVPVQTPRLGGGAV